MKVAYIFRLVEKGEKYALTFAKSLVVLCIILCSLQSCVPRCTKFPAYTQCKVRMRHMHTGKEYRGVPIHKKQHMQYGEKYKGPSKDAYSAVKTPKSRKRLFTKRKAITTKPKQSRKKKQSGPILKPFGEKN